MHLSARKIWFWKKTSVRDIYKSFVCCHKALKGLGACLLLAHKNMHIKAFLNKTFWKRNSFVDVPHWRAVQIWGVCPKGTLVSSTFKVWECKVSLIISIFVQGLRYNHLSIFCQQCQQTAILEFRKWLYLCLWARIEKKKLRVLCFLD